MKRLMRLTALLLAFAMFAAACGGDDDDAETGSEPSEEATTDDGGEAADDDGEATDDDGEAMAEDDGEAMAEDDGEAMAEDDGEATDDGGSDDPGLAAAEAVLAANAEPPTTIGPTIPLESVPEPKTVAWLQCDLPSCAAIGVGFADAVATLGWELEVIGFTNNEPAPAFQQALDLGVDYVALTGLPPALYQDQLDAAAEAGIAFVSCYDTTEPLGAENNVWMQCGDANDVFAAGELIANSIIADSGGDANVLMVNIPDFPVLVSEREGSEAAYAANCPGCTFNELAVTLEQLGAGDVPGAVVSALQSDPDINYVHLAFDGLHFGVSTTLEEAGLLEGVNIVGVDFSGAVLTEVVNGTHQFWTANPKPYAAWLMVDAMARHSIGQENTEERANADLPSFVASASPLAEELIPTDGWYGPEGTAEQFAALWGVAG